VVQIEPASRTVTIGRRSSLEKIGLEASNFNWHVEPPDAPMPCHAQIRARHKAVPAIVEPLANGRTRVLFDQSQSAVTPGQVVAVYDQGLLLGGGWIDRALDAI
jgi:tRNA-specific 2-thiouridylase